MGERKHKVEDGEKKAKVKPGIKTSPQVTHPILQLQQMVGNKAVTKMIQRHPSDFISAHRGVSIQVNRRNIYKLIQKTNGISGKVDLLEGVVSAQTGRMNRHTKGGGHRI